MKPATRTITILVGVLLVVASGCRTPPPADPNATEPPVTKDRETLNRE